ncbi:MAG: acetate--CoA ligase family protein [Thermodesulfobacteriota bacterium]
MDCKHKQLLREDEAVKLLGQYGVPYPEHKLVCTADEAAEIAESLGFPVVLKISAKNVIHKSDAGGVATGLNSPEEVRQAYLTIEKQVREAVPDADIQGMLVCSQADEGLELIVGGLHDPDFGPTVMFGLGGIFTEALNDVKFRLVPLKRIDARKMIREIKGYSVLQGVRGQSPRDLEALADLLISVSNILNENPDIKELDLNPVRIYENRLMALDARVICETGN